MSIRNATNSSGSGGGGAPTGSAGGALSGTYPNPGVSALATNNASTADSHGYKAQNYSIELHNANTTALTAGTIYVMRVPILVATTLQTIAVYKATASTTVTNAFLGIYDGSSGSQLAVTTDKASDFNTGTGVQEEACSSATSALTPGTYVDVAFLQVGGTPGTYLRMNPATAAALTVGVSGTAFLAATAGTGQSTLPSTLGAKIAANSTYIWVGLR